MTLELYLGVRGQSTNQTGVIGISDLRVNVQRLAGKTGNGVEGVADAGVGVSGFSKQGAGVFGFSDFGYGGQFSGARASLRLQPGTTVGRPTTGNHQAGEFFVDENPDLFFCKLGGTPGTWFLVLVGA